MVVLIGAEIKRLRLAKKLTIKELAKKTGLSVGLISNVENDVNSPTISSLHKICGALNTNIAELFGSITNGSILFRYKDCQKLVLPDNKTTCYLFPLINRKLQPSFIVMERGGHYGENPMTHEGEEVCLVLSGKIEIIAGSEKYILEQGDGIYIEPFVPHKMRNIGPVKAETIWVTLYNK